MLFSWSNIYYIVKKEGDNTLTYFKIKKYKKCIIHESRNCGCQLELTFRNIEPFVENYIKFYNFCSALFMINNGKLKYVNMNSKYSIISNN